jgi:hypothetical protein
MIHRPRRLGAVVLSIGCMCAVTACGSSSKSGSGSNATPPAGRGTPVGFKLTSTQRSCLKKQGVTLPTGGSRPGASPNGSSPRRKFPKGKGKFPGAGNGTPAAGFAKQSGKRLAAFKACGVSFPSRQSPPTAAG